MKIYKLISGLSCAVITVRFTPHSSIEFDGWIGAHLRNRLLYFMESVPYGFGLSTREFLTNNPMEDNHPLYKELAGGAPKGYSLRIKSPKIFSQKYTIDRSTPIEFSVTLVGVLAMAVNHTVEALHILARQGLNKVSFDCEIVSVESKQMRDLLAESCIAERVEISINTPMSLFKTKNRSSKESFQVKLNGLPSLYQIVYSAANKLVKMSALYCGAMWSDEFAEAIDQISEECMTLMINSCHVDQERVTTYPRVSDGRRMYFRGVVGRMSWTGDAGEIIPLLKFVSYLGLGNDTVYGMGEIEINSK